MCYFEGKAGFIRGINNNNLSARNVKFDLDKATTFVKHNVNGCKYFKEEGMIVIQYNGLILHPCRIGSFLRLVMPEKGKKRGTKWR